MKRAVLKKRIPALLLAAALILTMTACGSAEGSAAAEAPGDRLVLAYAEELYEAPARYLYDSQGRPVRKIQEDWNRVTEYTYHSTGELMEACVYDDGVLAEITQYDTRGNTLRVLYGEERTVEKAYTNSYDDQGRLQEQTCRTGEETLERWAYTYHSDGSYTVEFWDDLLQGNTQIPHCHNVKTYNSEDVLIASETDLDCMTEVSITYNVLPDERGSIARTREDTFFDGVYSMTEYYYEHTYDAQGRIIQSDCYYTFQEIYPDGTETRVLKEYWDTTYYTYDAAGRKIHERIEYPDTDFFEESTWEYDAQGNLLSHGNNAIGTAYRYEYKPLSQVLYDGK